MVQRCPKVSVIIPNYNYALFVADAINSVLAQTYSNYEIIVVNNGSTDNSLEVLREFEKQIVLINQNNLGQSGARNQGLLRASGEVIAFLDADDYWEPNKLENQIPLLNSEVQLVYCGINIVDSKSSRKRKEVLPKYRGSCQDIGYLRPGIGVVLSGESTVIMSKDLVTQVGFFDSKLNSSAGWDYFRRCAERTKFEYVNLCLSNYRLHNSNMSSNSKAYTEDLRRAYLKMYFESGSRRKWALRLRCHLLLEITFIKRFIKENNFRNMVTNIFNLPFFLFCAIFPDFFAKRST